MGITDALRLQEGSIRELAMLPQQQILKMAQMGQLSVSMVPIVLNEKAQMAQQAANMQAMAQQMPPTVIEQAIATNAQAEAPQQPVGIEALPQGAEMFNETSLAGGGIVAFEDGGSVPRYQNQGVVTLPQRQVDPKFLRAQYLSKGLELPEELMTEDELRKKRFLESTRQPSPAGVFPTLGKFLSDMGTSAEGVMTNYGGFGFYDKARAGTPTAATAPASDYADELTRGSARRAALSGEGRTMDEMRAPPAVAPAPAKKGAAKVEAPAETPTEDIMARRKRLLKEAGVAEDPFAEDRAANEALRAELGKEREQLRNMSLLEAGLSIMGGSSPYALQNLAEAKGAIGSYAKGMRAIKEDQKEYAKIDRDLRKAADALKRGDVDKALEYEEKAEDRKLKLRQVVASEQAARKPSTVEEYYRLQKAAEGGDKAAQKVLQGMFGAAKLGLVDERFLRERWDKMDKLEKLKLNQKGIGFEQWAASQGYPVGGAGGAGWGDLRVK